MRDLARHPLSAAADRIDARLETLTEWIRRPRKPTMPQRQLDLLHTTHNPRVQFIKTLPLGARLLDFGAGDGGLITYRTFPEPLRKDLRFYAYSLEPRPDFARYDGAEIARFEERRPHFGGMKFDAIFASHVIEHLDDHAAFIAWAADAMAPGGRIYIEWPSPASLRLPKREAFLACGVDLMITHFHDDATHTHLPDMQAVLAQLVDAGFAIDQAGYVHTPFFEDELLAHDQGRTNPGYRLAAFWSHTYWAQSVIATRLPD